MFGLRLGKRSELIIQKKQKTILLVYDWMFREEVDLSKKRTIQKWGLKKIVTTRIPRLHPLAPPEGNLWSPIVEPPPQRWKLDI